MTGVAVVAVRVDRVVNVAMQQRCRRGAVRQPVDHRRRERRRRLLAGPVSGRSSRRAGAELECSVIMNWSWLFFLGEPWFVWPWYAVGFAGMWFLVYDMRNHNTPLKPAMKWGWPIIVFFFSVLGLALYFATARAPGIGTMKSEEEKKRAHDEYEKAMWRRTNGAAIHCVAGDGFGIMTAMVIARAGGMSFWQEFWFEYVVGFAIGWFVFQRKSMTMMTDSLPKQLAMAFRGEFFSMLTVMGGMGGVMTYVTPMVATAQPRPLTYSFWGFGMLGLLVGYVLTLPMNYLMIKIGWKHGMGGMEGAKPIEGRPKKAGVVAAMVVLGSAALLFVQWLTVVRHQAPRRDEPLALTPARTAAGSALYDGIQASLERALDGLHKGDRTEAAKNLDAAHRAAAVGAHSAPGAFYAALEQIRNGRYALQQGQPDEAIRHLQNARKLVRPAISATPAIVELEKYDDAMVIDQKGAVIGKVSSLDGDVLKLSLGGWRDAWGFADFGGKTTIAVRPRAVAFGPPRVVGRTLVMLPTQAAAKAAF